MYKEITGKLIGKDLKIGIIVGRFNEFISSRLLSGTIDALIRHEVNEKDIEVAWVPGAFEIPLTAQRMAATKKYDALICLGAVIRGATPHFDYVSTEVSKGIAKIGLETGLPVIFGIITSNNIEQAIERAGTKNGNKGWEAGLTAIEMVNLLKSM